MRPSRARVSGARRGQVAALLVALVGGAALVTGPVRAMVEGDAEAPAVSSIVVAARSSGASLTSGVGKAEGVLRIAPTGEGGDLDVYLALEGLESGVAHLALRHGGDDGPIVLATSTGATPSTGAACAQLLGPDASEDATPSAPSSDATAFEAMAAGCVQQAVGVVQVPLVVPSRLPPGRYSLCAAFEAAGRWRPPLCRALELLPVRAFALDLEGPVDFGGGLESGVRSSVEGDLVRGNGNGTIVNVGNVPFAVDVTFGRMRNAGPGVERTIAGEFDARVVSQEGATAHAEGLVVPLDGSGVHAVLGGVCVQPGTAARVDIGLTPSGPLERGRYEGFVTFGAASAAGCVAPPFTWDLVVVSRAGPFSAASAAPTSVASGTSSPTPTPTSARGAGAVTETATPLPAVVTPPLASPVVPATPEVTPTATPTAASTSTPAPTPTTTPVATPSPTSVPTATPTAAPTATAAPLEVTPAASVATPQPTVEPAPTPPAATGPAQSSGGGGA